MLSSSLLPTATLCLPYSSGEAGTKRDLGPQPMGEEQSGKSSIPLLSFQVAGDLWRHLFIKGICMKEWGVVSWGWGRALLPKLIGLNPVRLCFQDSQLGDKSILHRKRK